jgi:coenzyme F420-reducing hydrogenase gamma subunit
MIISMAVCCGSGFFFKNQEEKLAANQQFVRVEQAQTVFDTQTVREVEMTERIN